MPPVQKKSQQELGCVAGDSSWQLAPQLTARQVA